MTVTLQDVIFDKMCVLENAFSRQEHLDVNKRDTILDHLYLELPVTLSWLNRMNIALRPRDREILQFCINAFEDKTEWK